MNHQKQVRSTAVACLPSVHPAIAESDVQFTVLYQSQSQTTEAFFCMEAARQIRQESVLPDHMNSIHFHGVYATVAESSGV